MSTTMRLMRSVINPASSLVPCRMSIGNIAHHRVVVYWVHQRAMILIGQGLKHFVFAKVTIQQPNGTTQQRQITFRRVVGVA